MTLKRTTSLFLVMAISISTSLARTNNKYSRFIKKEAAKSKRVKEYNPYQDIWSGGIALAVGTIGYYTTNHKVLQLTYSGVQSLGIVNLGTAVYDYYRPNLEYDIYQITRKLGKKSSTNSEMISKDFIRHLAKEDRAKRYALLTGSSLLTAQYFSNAFLDDVNSDLKEIYTFLGVVNAIVMTYSYFYRSKYESIYFSTRKSKTKISIAPASFPQGPGLISIVSF